MQSVVLDCNGDRRLMSGMSKWFVRRSMCPVCESLDFRLILSIRYDESGLAAYLEATYSPIGVVEWGKIKCAEFVLCECASCSAIFQRDVPNDEFMARLYGVWIDPELARVRNESKFTLTVAAGMAEEIMQVLAYIAREPARIEVLDFGMGWGNWAKMVASFGCKVYGVEVEATRIAEAAGAGIKNLQWNDLGENRFDFINTEQVFEHLASPLETLVQLRDSLRNQGIIKISVPTATDINRRLDRMDWRAPKGSRDSINPIAPLEHINFFRRKSISAMAAKAGMREVFLPMNVQYRYSTDWGGRFLKNLAMPVVKNWVRRQNYVFLRKTQS